MCQEFPRHRHSGLPYEGITIELIDKGKTVPQVNSPFETHKNYGPSGRREVYWFSISQVFTLH
jgi:hypothetical protein